MKFLVESRSTVDGVWRPARQFEPRWIYTNAREAVHDLDELCEVSNLPLDHFRIRRIAPKTAKPRR